MMFIAAILSFVLVQVVAREKSITPGFSRIEEAVRNPTKVLAIPSASSPVTVQPDFSSSSSTYWLVDVQYSGVTCDTSTIMEHGVATGWCVQTGFANSVMYECTSVTACVVHFYSDTTCGTETANSPLPFELNDCQTSDADDDGYLTDDGGTFGFQQTIARVGYPSMFSGSSGIISYYGGSTTCSQSALYRYQAFYQDHCYSNYDGTDYTSGKLSDSYQYHYTEVGCVAENIDGKYLAPINSCEIDSATTSSMTTLSDNGSSSNNTGVIIGAVVGSVCGVILIGALVYFFMFYKAKAPMGQQGDSSRA